MVVEEVSDICVCVCVCVCMCVHTHLHISSHDLLFWDYLFLVFSCVWLTSLGWSFPSSTFCRTEFIDGYCLNLVLICNVLLSQSIVSESFAGYIVCAGICVSVAYLSRPF